MVIGGAGRLIEKQIDTNDLLGEAGVVVKDTAVTDVEKASRAGDLPIDRVTDLSIGLERSDAPLVPLVGVEEAGVLCRACLVLPVSRRIALTSGRYRSATVG